ncbi:PREDICTED: restin homolog [Theobroma cacao]|uniref:Restin homolog n=1 Tax=Theobroma cacao TaxID=3641 RepID=A0AB32UVV0_THECC|nr:PREDICTED: restin homolog [Theobroma cacao]XP_007018880.2 PREDICTED: restin homolog [Theobroma cacao]XP_017981401.1 PREDICTED: restin homolog [Theobroma cacao]XP_017981402.1 PREDICTED: restin homolog [Theobroma cacao]
MSRVTKWKIEKTKIKVVFRLQFHATHIPQSGWDKLHISFIPADSGKATLKTTKANVRNGTCKWADPIYETTRLLQDIKTKQFDEKLYKLLVAMGSSRSSLLGEATINLADYADASKPSIVALPLHSCDSGAILHVTVQLLTSKTGFREFEQQRELRERKLQAGPDQNGPDQSSSGKVSVSEESVNSHMDKVNTRVRFKEKSKEHHLLEEDVGLNEEYGDSAVGFDGSSNTSESLYAEKHDTSSTHEIDSLKSTASGDLGGLSHSPQQEKGDPSDHQILAQGTNDWIHGWSSDYSADNDLTIAYEENSRLRGCLEVAESSIQDLKVEVSLLQNHASQIGAETEKFAEQLVTEISSGERLAKEVSALKSECSKLKDDLEQMTNYKLCPALSSKEAIRKDQDHLFQDLEVTWSKGLLVMEDKIRELQNKACLNNHERDLRFLHADLEALLGILQDLKQGTQEEISVLRSVPSERCNMKGSREISLNNGEQFIPETSFDAELYQPELGMVPCVSLPGLMSHEPDSVGATTAMKGKIFELLRELDESKAERESLAKKMDQMECYYEALVQELEENQRQMLGELQSLRNEHSACLYRVQSTKAEMETMQQDMSEQILRFSEEKQDLESLSKELERRAIIAEAALKRARLNYSIAVGQLQKDLELLSSQVMSVFETNDNLIRQAFVDSSQPSSQGYSEMVKNRELDPEEFQPTKPLHCQNQYVGVRKQQLGGDILLEDLKRSLHLQESLYLKVEEEVCEMHYQNVYLDVFSKTLQEALLEASADVKHIKERTDELMRQLELSVESKELLMQRLQSAMDDVHSLNEYKATCIAKYNDMAVQKQTLEANVETVTHENHLLSEKITEMEHHLMEYKSYKSKYDACAMAKTELASLLKKETLENGNLRNENSSLQEDLRMIKGEFDELVTVKTNLQNTVDFLRSRLLNLLSSYGKNFDELSLLSDLVGQDIESKDLTSVMVWLEEVQHNAHEKFLHLLKENKELMEERDKALVSLTAVESDMVLMKQKFEGDIRAMVDKMDLSNVVVQRVQLEVEAVAGKLRVSSEVEETYAQQQRDLLSDIEHFEAELQQLTSKNREIAEELLVLESVNEELGSSKLTVTELMEENKALMQSLQDKSEESSKLSLELNGLKESLRSVHDELLAERSSKDKLESLVTNLTSQMNEKHHQLLHFDQQKSELIHLKQMLSDLELEKSRVCSRLQQSEECLNNARKESSSITFLESQLSEMHGFLIAADVSLIFLRKRYETWTADLVCQLSLSESRLVELQKKHLDAKSMLNGCLAREAHCIEENARLSASLESLKSELDASMAENRVLLNKNSSVIAELQEYKSRIEKLEFGYCEDKNQHALEVERLKQLLVSSREEIDNLMVLKEELELNVVVLKAKLDEQSSQITLLEGPNDEVLLLQNQCNELSQRLSEQILKTEEFKNLSIHLKELKDKADAECIQAREKRESEAPPTAMQESLRIAFIKEQYESRLQELKHQLAVSKKHSEEMLWKLQDAIDDIENRKKSEASLLKTNEELGVKILDLEAELQSLISDKREKMRAYDLMKAELDCSMISLECCKEEKQKLEASLQECNEEKSRILVELSIVKELLETSTSTMSVQKERNDKLKDGCISDELVVNNAPTSDVDLKYSEQDTSTYTEEAEQACLVPIDEGDCTRVLRNMQPEQDFLASSNVNGVQSLALVNPENLLNSDAKHLALINDRFKAQSLRSSMDHLNSELERMKNENLLLSEDGHHFDSKFPGLQLELMQLHKVNEELGSMFPLFNEYPESGNALERVLALELELAEALETKKKSSILFQSSFLKQHNDEEAVFKSFKDINELIKDMLEIKGRYGAVETELKEMHERYSQLSLQFAEVEGERQKLMMTLKNMRASRKAQNLNRSSSAALGDHS